jgi:nucleoside-diphosphate-sugar epimerase
MRAERVIATDNMFDENAAWWSAACDGVDTVLHLAWYVTPGSYLESERNLECLEGTLRLARGAADARVRRMVGVGTCFEYDLTQGVPPGHFKASSPLAPSTTYAACKAAAYLALLHWAKARKLSFLWCRLFYLFGEGEDMRRLVPYVRAQLELGKPAELTSGKQIRDFLNVDDAAGLLVDAALGTSEGACNVCSGRGVSVRALAESIADEYGRRDLLRFGARLDNRFDPPCVVGMRG